MSIRMLSVVVAGFAGAIALGCTAVMPPASQPPASKPPTSQPSPAPTSGTAPAAVSFRGDVVPVLKQHCAACHTAGGGGASAVAMFDASGEAQHAAISANIERMITAIESGRMPLGKPNSVPQEAIQTLKAWKDAGAPAQ